MDKILLYALEFMLYSFFFPLIFLFLYFYFISHYSDNFMNLWEACDGKLNAVTIGDCIFRRNLLKMGEAGRGFDVLNGSIGVEWGQCTLH